MADAVLVQKRMVRVTERRRPCRTCKRSRRGYIGARRTDSVPGRARPAPRDLSGPLPNPTADAPRPRPARAIGLDSAHGGPARAAGSAAGTALDRRLRDPRVVARHLRAREAAAVRAG